MITFERAKLYDEVWKEPVTKLAVKYNIPDSLMRKICSKQNVDYEYVRCQLTQ